MEKTLITLLIVAIVVIVAGISLISASAVPLSEEVESETISFSYGYETRMVETHPFGEDGPVVVGCEGVYFD